MDRDEHLPLGHRAAGPQCHRSRPFEILSFSFFSLRIRTSDKDLNSSDHQEIDNYGIREQEECQTGRRVIANGC